LVWATHKFRYYLHGRQFLVHTDHKSLEWLQSTRFDNNKVERWALRLQEFAFAVVYKPGEENVVADCLSRFCGLQLVHVPSALQTAVLYTCGVRGNWSGLAAKQADLDSVPCVMCDHPGGWDNMAICDKCNDCYHLRCVFPPMSTVPSGAWFCPRCDPVYRNWQELYCANPPLQYHEHDPHLNAELLVYLEGGMYDDLLPLDPKRARAIKHLACAVRLHPDPLRQGWLLVRRKRHNGGIVWLTCPPLEYRWDLLRVYHDALGHCGAQQMLLHVQQYFHWGGIKEDAQQFVRVCEACQKRRLALPELPDLRPPVLHAGPFRHIHVDLAGPFPTPMISIHGKITDVKEPVKAYVVLMIDYFTKAAEFYVIYSKQPVAVA